MYQIYDDIEMPAVTRGNRASRYPFAEMEVGHSFFVPIEDGDPIKLQKKIVSAACKFCNDQQKRDGLEKRKFSVRRYNDSELGVWRVA